MGLGLCDHFGDVHDSNSDLAAAQCLHPHHEADVEVATHDGGTEGEVSR